MSFWGYPKEGAEKIAGVSVEANGSAFFAVYSKTVKIKALFFDPPQTCMFLIFLSLLRYPKEGAETLAGVNVEVNGFAFFAIYLESVTIKALCFDRFWCQILLCFEAKILENERCVQHFVM